MDFDYRVLVVAKAIWFAQYGVRDADLPQVVKESTQADSRRLGIA